MRDINLKATEYFEAAARLGTVTKAAAELGVSPSAVSQQIKLLETQFGVMLFRREKRRLKLTLDGDRLYQTTTQAFAALRNARTVIGEPRGQRGLNVRVSPSFGVRWLGPRIADFASRNPDWDIRINATPEFSEFDTDAIDLDLRYGLGEWTGLTVECIMQDAVLPLCSPELLKKAGKISDPVGRLQSALLIDSVKSLYRWELWLAASGFEVANLSYPFRFDRSSMSIEMAKQGGGVALDSALLCKGEIERGELVPFLPDTPVIAFSAYWFVCPARHLNRRIVNRFFEWISQEAKDHQMQVHTLLEQCGCTFRIAPNDELLSGEAAQ